MSEMEKLVLDRLMDFATRDQKALRNQLEASARRISDLERQVNSRIDEVKRLRDSISVKEKGSDKITELYKAADAYLRGGPGRPTKDQTIKGRELNQALIAAEPYIDLLPF